jgi:hypothetical protein
MGQACSRDRTRNAKRIWVRKPLRRQRRRWEVDKTGSGPKRTGFGTNSVEPSAYNSRWLLNGGTNTS